MSLPYFPMYPTDFEAKTSHLTLEEDGAYNRLLRLCWMSPCCSLPDDDAWIRRRMRVDQDTYDRVVKVVLEEFFTRSNGRLSNARLIEEFEKSNAAHQRRKSAGSKGGNAKALKTKEIASSNATPIPEQCFSNQNQNHIKKEPKGSQKKGTRLSEDWTPSEDDISFAAEQGLSNEEIAIEADRFRDHWISKSGQDARKVNWTATWRNWIRSPLRRNNSTRPKEQPRSMGALILERRAKRQGDIHAENGNRSSQFEF